MSAKDDGGPAFPNVPEGAGKEWQNWDLGMSLRDYFAAKVFAVFLREAGDDWRAGKPVHIDGYKGMASQAYDAADAMLEARKK